MSEWARVAFSLAILAREQRSCLAWPPCSLTIPHAQKSLRLWPGGVTVAIQWLLRFIVPIFDPEAKPIKTLRYLLPPGLKKGDVVTVLAFDHGYYTVENGGQRFAIRRILPNGAGIPADCEKPASLLALP